MELDELNALISDPTKLVSKVSALAPEIPEQAINFQPEDHRVVKDIPYRPFRKVDVPTGLVDANEEPTYRTESRDVHRIPSSLQKHIINWSVDLALSGGVDIDCTPSEDVPTDATMLAMVKKTLDDNKFDYLAMEIERIKQRFLTVLLVWYAVLAEPDYWGELGRPESKYKMRCVILSPEDGDTIIPIRDQYKDMIGAARLYDVTIDDKDVKKMDLFLNDRYITFVQATGSWILEKDNPIAYGKANFILDEQKRTEWADVDSKIERIEEVDSDTADENKQSAFPILVGTGTITSASGGENSNTRKTFQLEGEKADLKYVETQGGQEAAGNERKNLRTDIFIETETPDLKFEDIAGDLPGVTIEMMLLPSTNKARRKHKGSIGIFHQRNLNFLKSAMAVINTDVKPSLGLVMKPKFTIELPKNYTEMYSNIVSLVGAGLMSKETAIKELGFTSDPVAEFDKIKTEAKEAAALIQKPNPVNPPTNV